MAMYKSKKMPSIYGEDHEDYENGHKPVYARVIDGEYPAEVQPGAKRMVKDEQGATMFLLAMCSLAAEVQRRLERRSSLSTTITNWTIPATAFPGSSIRSCCRRPSGASGNRCWAATST